MYRVFTCLTTQHDPRLLVLAVLVCIVESFIALYVYRQIAEARGFVTQKWLAVAGLCTGSSIWATHFVAVLAYDSQLPVAYDVFPTAISLLLAIVATTLGLRLSAAGSRWRAMAGGLIIGLGTAVMHFTGMRALLLPGTITWDMPFVFAAIALGCVFSAAAMLAFRERKGMTGVLAATALLSLAITSMHFTAMTAVTVVPDPTIPVVAAHFSPFILAIVIVVITLVVLCAGFVVSLWESRVARDSALTAGELVNASSQALVLADDGIIVDANRRAIELWGRPLQELIGKPVFGGLLDGYRPHTSTNEIFSFETFMKPAQRAAIPVEIVRQPLHTAMRANEVFAISDLRPLIETTDRLRRMNEELQAREKQLRHQNLLFNTALSHMTQGLCMYDAQQRIVVSNRRYAELYGLTPDQVKPGTLLTDVIEARIANGIYANGSPEAYRQERVSVLGRNLDMVQELNDGRFISILLRLMPGGGYVSTHEDVTERRRIEARLAHMAHHDPLTDLPNRALLRERLEKALKGIRKHDPYLAVLMLDLDRFKEVNDTLGHLVGDLLIKGVAERLREGMRQTATVARFGGDEFAIIEPLGPGDDEEALPRRVQEILSMPMELDGHRVSIGTSIGIAIAPRHGIDPDDLVKKADRALYTAKAAARGSYRFYDEQMDTELQERRALEHELHKALPAGQLELHYQPIVDLKRDEITGFEALMRWNHPMRGPISPTIFIPLAEDSGLITVLTEWALEEACTEAAKWPDHLKVAVNLSVLHFKSRNLVASVSSVLKKTQLQPHRLELEITETVMLNDAESVFAIFRQLHQLGVRIVLDDFGTGFSSLSYLLRFPFDKIKIDRSFISDLAQGGSSLVLVRSLIQMARGLGVSVTAEGIETVEQLEIVRAEGCTEIQGYYISPPRPAAELRQRELRQVITQECAVA